MSAMAKRRRRRPRGYYEVNGLDLGRELERLCSLPLFGGPGGELATKPPDLTVRRASRRPRRNLGFAVPTERRISVTAYPGIRAGDLQETLLHELVHIAVGRLGGAWHGSVFRQTLQEAMRQAYGIDASPRAASVHGVYAEALEERSRAAIRPQKGLHPGQLALEAA
jgi:hypothetical protein